MPMPATADPPVAPTTPPPTAAPSAETPPAAPTDLESNFDKAFEEAAEPVKPPETPPATPPKGKEGERPKPEAKPAPAKPEPKPKPEDAEPLPKEITESRDIKQLREYGARQYKTAKTLEKEKLALETRLQELEQVVPKTQSEKTALAKKLADYEKRIADYEERIQLVDFRQSDRYRNDFEKPYVTAYNAGVTDIKQCQVEYESTTEKEDDGVTPKKFVRPGTERDLQWILGLDRVMARREAKKYFPEDWENVMDNYNAIVPLRDKILAEEKNLQSRWKQIQEEETAQRTAAETQRGELWQTINDQLIAKNLFFAERKDDTEGNAILRKGYELADAFFSDERLKLSPEKQIKFDALVRNMVGAYPRLVRDWRKANAEVEQLKAQIAELRGSKPGEPKPSGGETPPAGDESKTVAERFDEKL